MEAEEGKGNQTKWNQFPIDLNEETVDTGRHFVMRSYLHSCDACTMIER